MNEETAGGSGGPFQPQEGTGGQLWGAHGSVQQGGGDGKDQKGARKHEFAFVQRPDHACSMQGMSDWVDPLLIKQEKQEIDWGISAGQTEQILLLI